MFPIGVFPYVMIASTLIFFNDNFHKKIIDFISKYSLLKKSQFNIEEQNYTSSNSNILKVFLIGFFTVQFFLPMRFIYIQENYFGQNKVIDLAGE